MDIRVLINDIPTDWKNVLLNYPDLDKIESFLKREKILFDSSLPIFPAPENIFRCFHYRNVANTKVVILGQDPYHGDEQATGLCFGVNKHMKSPPSLKNIMKELKGDGENELKDITLEQWAKQGVLLLNSALTVRKKSPASHMKIWLPFTKYIIHHLNQTQKDIVFIAWGAFAYDKLAYIDQTKHKLLVSSHPSPLSAYRMYGEAPAFIGSQPFSKVNKYLKELREKSSQAPLEIKWTPQFYS